MSRRAIYGFFFIVLFCSFLSLWYYFIHINPHVETEGFESGYGEWIIDGDVPLDPNNPGYPVKWNITRVSNVSHSGEHSLRFFIDGRQDDGVIWVERVIETRKSSNVRVEISFEFFSDTKSFNTIATIVAYIGIDNPESIGDFLNLGPANMIGGWKNYGYSVLMDTDSSGDVCFAVGISVAWETCMTYYVDDVKIEIQ